MATITPQSYPVPRPLWDALRAALMAKSRELVKDIAKQLRQDEKKLMKAILQDEKKDLYLIEISDPTEDRFQCTALVETTKVAHRCRKPVQYGEKFCPSHRFWTMPERLRSKPTLLLLKDEDGNAYYLDTLTQQIYNHNYDRVGYKDDTKIYIFEIEEDTTVAQ